MPPKRKTDEDYSKLTVAKLKALCKKRGLDTVGKKQELVDSLKKDDGDAGGKKASLLLTLTILWKSEKIPKSLSTPLY